MIALTILLRLLATFMASLMFGLERQKSHKPVGFGTFTFVSLGACALGVITSLNTVIGSTSLLGAIVTGIGFLGAGALVRGTDRVFGFTTASAIWLFAIFGLIVGIGEYFVAIIVYLLLWAVIYVDRELEKKGIGSYQKRLNITASKIINEKELNNMLLKHTNKHKLLCAEIDKNNHEIHLTYLVDGPREHLNKMMHDMYEEEWFKSAKIE